MGGNRLSGLDSNTDYQSDNKNGNNYNILGEVLTVVKMWTLVFCVVTPCDL
jgi:hypothetical protein